MKALEFVRALEPVLYHACQLRDLELYVELGHVASRREMFGLGNTIAIRHSSRTSSTSTTTTMGAPSAIFPTAATRTTGSRYAKPCGPITLEFRAGGRSKCWSDRDSRS